MTATTIQEILDQLIACEQANDAHPMASFLTNDFRFIGPAGFVITSEQFLGRFDNGQLKTTSFALTNTDIREHDNVAVAIGVWTQETTFQGHPNNGNFRFAGTLVRDATTDNEWKLLHAQLSPMLDSPA